MFTLATIYQASPLLLVCLFAGFAVALATIGLLGVVFLIVDYYRERSEDRAFRLHQKETRPCPPTSAPPSPFVSVPYSLAVRRRLYSGMSAALET